MFKKIPLLEIFQYGIHIGCPDIWTSSNKKLQRDGWSCMHCKFWMLVIVSVSLFLMMKLANFLTFICFLWNAQKYSGECDTSRPITIYTTHVAVLCPQNNDRNRRTLVQGKKWSRVESCMHLKKWSISYYSTHVQFHSTHSMIACNYQTSLCF